MLIAATVVVIVVGAVIMGFLVHGAYLGLARLVSLVAYACRRITAV